MLKVKSKQNEPTFMTKVVFLMSMGNWSVSHPRSGEPVFESTEPNIPNLSSTKKKVATHVAAMLTNLW